MRKFIILFTTLSFWSLGNAFTQEAPSQSVGVARLTPEVCNKQRFGIPRQG